MSDIWRDLVRDVIGENPGIVIAGAFGGLVRWIAPPAKTWQQGVLALVAGAICARYLSPLAIPLMEPVLRVVIDDEVGRQTTGGFIVGIAGIGIVGFILDVLDFRRRQISARLGHDPRNGNAPPPPSPPAT